MDKKKIDKLLKIISELESYTAEEKLDLVQKLKYMPEWQLDNLKAALIKVHQEEEKFKSDMSRLELKYEMNIKKTIESKDE